MEEVLLGDALEQLRTLDAESVYTCVTSPPYYNLRDYGADGQIGAESTPEEYVERLVTVFREVRRVLRQDGTLWLNIGDSYASKTGTLAIVNLKGGTGKTISAANMAHILAALHRKKVLLVDGDKQGNASRYFQVYGEHDGTAALLLADGLDTESVERTIYWTGYNGLDIITSNMDLYTTDGGISGLDRFGQGEGGVNRGANDKTGRTDNSLIRPRIFRHRCRRESSGRLRG